MVKFFGLSIADKRLIGTRQSSLLKVSSGSFQKHFLLLFIQITTQNNFWYRYINQLLSCLTNYIFLFTLLCCNSIWNILTQVTYVYNACVHKFRTKMKNVCSCVIIIMVCFKLCCYERLPKGVDAHDALHDLIC